MSLLASNNLTGEILTWAIPVGALIIVGLYWALLLRRRSAGARTGRVE